MFQSTHSTNSTSWTPLQRLRGTGQDLYSGVNPALDIPTHPKIATGIATSKFGIASGLIIAAYREALACDNVLPVGVTCHIGSQILEIDPFIRAAGVMGTIAGELTAIGV